jgi:hypothetical protein
MGYKVFFTQISLRAVGIGTGGICSPSPWSAVLSISSQPIRFGAWCSFIPEDWYTCICARTFPKALLVITICLAFRIELDRNLDPYSIVGIW